MRSINTAAALVIVGVLAFAAGSLAQPRYPEIDQAEGQLQGALATLRSARDIFGGYKRNAEQLINQAIGQLETGKQFAASRGY
jgi:hypothetical protein